MPCFDDYIIFVDESGDHSLDSIDSNYPMFVLAFCVFKKSEYARTVVPSVLELKFKHFGHGEVVLHEHEIRKSKGSFSFLFDAQRRAVFLPDLSGLIENNPFILIACAIRKKDLLARDKTPGNPYHIAMKFALEQIYEYLKDDLDCREGITHILFERRGKKEDKDLELEFRRVCGESGNSLKCYLPFNIILAHKHCNSAGLQLADLVARPIGRYILDPSQNNRAYSILEKKFRRGSIGQIEDFGLRVVP